MAMGAGGSPYEGHRQQRSRPWPGESTGPFHSRPVVVSRVHRPPQEAFHSCFGTRNGRRRLIGGQERGRAG